MAQQAAPGADLASRGARIDASAIGNLSFFSRIFLLTPKLSPFSAALDGWQLFRLASLAPLDPCLSAKLSAKDWSLTLSASQPRSSGGRDPTRRHRAQEL